MIRFSFLIVLLIALISSCSVVRNLPYSRIPVDISSDRNKVFCQIGNEVVPFNVKSLSLHFFDSLFPIITSQSSQDFQSWQRMCMGDTVYSSLLSADEYIEWSRTMNNLIKRHSVNFDSVIFSIPGKLIAYFEETRNIDEMRPNIDCVISSSGEFMRRYNEPDFNYSPSFVRTYYNDVIFREFIKDRICNMTIAIDRIYLRDNDKILCVMYLSTGKYYHNSSYRFYDPIENELMIVEFLYRECDPISIGVLNALRMNYRNRLLLKKGTEKSK